MLISVSSALCHLLPNSPCSREKPLPRIMLAHPGSLQMTLWTLLHPGSNFSLSMTRPEFRKARCHTSMADGCNLLMHGKLSSRSCSTTSCVIAMWKLFPGRLHERLNQAEYILICHYLLPSQTRSIQYLFLVACHCPIVRVIFCTF